MDTESFMLEKEITILSTYCDASSRLGLSQCFGLLQDCMTEYFGMLACDGVRLKPVYGCAWIITRTVLEIYTLPDWNTSVRCKTALTHRTRLIVELDTTVSTLQGKVLLRGKQELCLLNLQTRRPVPNDFLPQLAGALVEQERWNTRFARLSMPADAFLIPDLEQTVYPQDTDMNGHCNNVSYMRMLLNGVSTSRVCAMDPCRMDVSFVNECREGSHLRVFSGKEEGALLLELRCREQDACAERQIALCQICPLV
ncbi:MAG: thioesterase [Eubacteriales bacterium]|nr:thioesterase [Eubacteriales bacterium]